MRRVTIQAIRELRGARTTVVELLQACIARIGAVNPQLNIFVHDGHCKSSEVKPAVSVKAARDIDRWLDSSSTTTTTVNDCKEGDTPPFGGDGARLALAGVIVGVKDNFCVEVRGNAVLAIGVHRATVNTRGGL